MKRERQRTIIEAAKKAQEMQAPYIRDVLLAQVGLKITDEDNKRDMVENLKCKNPTFYRTRDVIDIEGHVVEEPKGLLTDGVD